jgi:hypothetical protein
LFAMFVNNFNVQLPLHSETRFLFEAAFRY